MEKHPERQFNFKLSGKEIDILYSTFVWAKKYGGYELEGADNLIHRLLKEHYEQLGIEYETFD